MPRNVLRLACCLSLGSPFAWSQNCKIEILHDAEPAIRYVSGASAYHEGFKNQQWAATVWGFENESAKSAGSLPAFEIRVKTVDSPASVPGELLANWNYIGAWAVPAPQPSGCPREAVVDLQSRDLPIDIKVHTILDGTPVLTRWLEITNNSKHPIAISSLFPLAGQLWQGDAVADVGYATRYDWQREGWFGWTRLKPGTNRIQQEHGLSFDHPYFLLRNETANEYFFAELEWPLNRVAEFYDRSGVSFKLGPTAANALIVLAPGETTTSPRIHLGHTRGSFDAAVQAMHDHIRKSVMYARNPDLAYRIELLMPEDWGMTLYRGEQFNETNLKKIIDVMEQLGLELFIQDGPSWCKTYGDWLTPQPKEFPNGLKPISDYAHAHHVLYGLYAEPEGGREASPPYQNGLAIGSWKESEVYRQHRDWFPEFVKTNEPKAVGPDDPRICPILNLANPEASNYLKTIIEAMVNQYGLDLYRNDFNAPLKGEGLTAERDGFTEAEYWRQYRAFDDVYDQIHRDLPGLIIQQASAGGTRMDLGTVARFSENYTSDRVTMPFVYRMLAGYTVYLPPETLVTPIGLANPKDLPDTDTMMRSIFALGSTPFIFNTLIPKSVDEITPEIRAKYLHYTSLYKNMIRPMLPTLRVYHHAPVNATGGVDSSDWFAMEFGSPDHRQGWATLVRLTKTAPEDFLLKPSGLDPNLNYKVEFDSTGAKFVRSGDQLIREGLRIKPGEGTISELVIFRAQGH